MDIIKDTDAYREDLRKALDIATGVTQGLYQPKIDKVIADLIDHRNPLWQNLPRKGADTLNYDYRQKTAQTGGTGGGFIGDTTEPSSDAGFTRVPVSVRHKAVLERGGVTTAMQKSGRSYRDLLADEIHDVTLLVRDTIEAAMVSDAVSATKMDGIRESTPAGQTILAATNGAELTLDLLDQVIDKCDGNPDMIVCSKRTRRQIKALLQAHLEVPDLKEVKGAFKLLAYSDIPIYTTSRITDVQEEGTSGTACSDLFVIDTEYVWLSMLEDVHMVPLAKTTSQADKFDIRGMMALIVKDAVKGLARLHGLTPTAP